MTPPTTAIAPVRWRPPKATARAASSAGPTPFELTVFGLPTESSEDVLVDADGSVLTAVKDGRILRLSADGDRITTIAHTGGRGLGLEFHPDGGLVICDVQRGVLRVWPDEQHPENARVQVLVGDIDGVPMRFCNNSAVAADGSIYFTDSSRHFGIDDYKGDLLEHAGTGRLFRRDPAGTVTLLLDGLHFPNGVALAEDESFLLFAQTGAYTVERLWLTGSRQGAREVFVDNLPAFPDNMSRGSDGLFWVALPSGRNRLLDLVSPWHPALRRLTWALPEALQPKEGRTVFAQAFDADGRLVHDLQQPNRDFYMCSGIRERDGVLWFGSLVCSAVGRTTL
ncbi:MAG: SMP-30/gluconolactonase/LRE family protein [Actinomycetota bacterium]|nr:SMP-30/gluconolactonase/LRE family protein [Actinomycetota bacterium]MDQ2957258.1 SMP-30/gluconolactonase/LRE family protein [Actinomycetota bacterium]